MTLLTSKIGFDRIDIPIEIKLIFPLIKCNKSSQTHFILLSTETAEEGHHPRSSILKE